MGIETHQFDFQVVTGAIFEEPQWGLKPSKRFLQFLFLHIFEEPQWGLKLIGVRIDIISHQNSKNPNGDWNLVFMIRFILSGLIRRTPMGIETLIYLCFVLPKLHSKNPNGDWNKTIQYGYKNKKGFEEPQWGLKLQTRAAYQGGQLYSKNPNGDWNYLWSIASRPLRSIRRTPMGIETPLRWGF